MRHHDSDASLYTDVAVFRFTEKAELAKAFLESFSIPARVANEHMSRYVVWGSTILQVPQGDLETAKKLLKQYFDEEKESRDAGILL